MDDISTPGESADKQGPSCSRAKSGREFKGKESTTELVQGISNQPTTAPAHGTWRITESVLEKESMTSLITLGETAHDERIQQKPWRTKLFQREKLMTEPAQGASLMTELE